MGWQRVSVLLPTRKRLGFLERMLASYEATVDDADLAEIVLRCDSDDPETIDFLRQRPHRFIVGPRAAGYRSLPRFFNEMAAVATGDVLMCCNDDVEFRTPGWPQLVLAAANQCPDGIFNFGVNVGLNDDKFPFSIVSRKLVDALGFLNDERLLFSDVFLLDVARAFNRAIRLESVTIRHDWAGHDCDDTRRDANQHEFAVAFKDATGAWSDEYCRWHEAAVAEAVERIHRAGLISSESVLQAVEAYRPTSLERGSWPPRVPWTSWKAADTEGIYYARTEAAQILDVIFRHRMNTGQAIVTSLGNGLPSLMWLKTFRQVISLERRAGPTAVTPHGCHTVISGDPGETKFLYDVLQHVHDLRAVIIDDRYYATAMSTYHLLGSRLERPGIVVFLPMSAPHAGDAGVRRFVNDLRTGAVDNRRHPIADVVSEPGGPGMSYELFF